ncbi:MAG: hypothetical protein R2794_08585 [Chitinophagales bacterium]
MRIPLIRIFFFFLFWSAAQHVFAVQDTVLHGVHIHLTYSAEIFPESWLEDPINAEGGQLKDTEIPRTIHALDLALAKYPEKILTYNCPDIYCLEWMRFYDVGYGGTNTNDAVYVTNAGLEMGYTDAFLESSFHHEFSSILFRNFGGLIDTTSWISGNPAQFEYGDPSGGAEAIRNGLAATDIDPELCAVGFLTQYSMSSMENDINMLAEQLFNPDPSFWQMVKENPRLAKKVDLLIAFYHQLDKSFTRQYFQGLGP